MAIAIIPIEADPTQKREGWLTMNQADELVCELFNEPVDEKHYCHNWFDKFWYFDWNNVKGFIHFDSNYAYDFKTADDAVIHFLKHTLHPTSFGDDIPFWDTINASIDYVRCYIEPIIRMFYNKGYKIVSLNLG